MQKTERPPQRHRGTEGPISFFSLCLCVSVVGLLLLAVAAFAQQPIETAPAATPEALTQKANAGDASAAFALGTMYERGNGVPKSAPDAVKWYRIAAEKGHVGAQFNLALILAKGRGVNADPAEAAKWYEKAALQGDQQAAINLGILYAQGAGVPQDGAQAAHWFHQAADAGNPMAEYNLGLLYANQLFSDGKGEDDDQKHAAVWFEKAADHGVVAAQNNIGVMYADGDGVAKDVVQAYKWWSLAAESGDQQSAAALKELQAEMKPEQVAAGKKLAEEWIAAHAK